MRRPLMSETKRERMPAGRTSLGSGGNSDIPPSLEPRREQPERARRPQCNVLGAVRERLSMTESLLPHCPRQPGPGDP